MKNALPTYYHFSPLHKFIPRKLLYHRSNKKIIFVNTNCMLIVKLNTLYRCKPNLDRTRVITPKRVSRGEVHLRGLAPRQHLSEETLQRWRTIGNTVSELNDPGFEPQTSRTGNNIFTTDLTCRLLLINTIPEDLVLVAARSSN